MPEETNVENVTVAGTPVIAIHDAILPWTWNSVVWGLANLGDNVETENSSMAELFESINKTLMTLSNMRDGFVENPPSIDAVKGHHNAFIRIDRYVKSRTKAPNLSRYSSVHISPVRKKFRRYPVRYFDLRNRWIRGWTEKYLEGLSNLAQMGEGNSYQSDWTIQTAELMMAPFREAYRTMVIDLFGKPLEDYQTEKEFPLLTSEDFDNYNPNEFIPTYELFAQPFNAFLTEDRVRDVATGGLQPGEGITADGGDTISPGEAAEQVVRDAQDGRIIP